MLIILLLRDVFEERGWSAWLGEGESVTDGIGAGRSRDYENSKAKRADTEIAGIFFEEVTGNWKIASFGREI